MIREILWEKATGELILEGREVGKQVKGLEVRGEVLSAGPEEVRTESRGGEIIWMCHVPGVLVK